MKRLLLNIPLLLSVLALFVSCQDDFLKNEDIGDGEATVGLTLEFEKMHVGLDNSRAIASGGAPGNAVSTINSITVIAYKQNGEFYKVWRAKGGANGGSGDFDYTIEENKDMPGDFNPEDNEHQAEAATQMARFSLKGIPFGRYKIYAVANVNVSDEEAKDISLIKERVLEWKTTISENDAMFGFFSADDRSGVRPQSFEADILTLNKPVMQLRAWVKRAVSKVTVAFDGRKLNDNVTIYIKDVQIRDIPNTCYLGMNNAPTSKDDLIAEGGTIVYGEGNFSVTNCQASITRGNPIYGAEGRLTGTPEEQIKKQHGEMTRALYFFENMQGKGEPGTESDKRQDVSGNNNTVSYPNGNDSNNAANKDAKPCGTYIEVNAYYENTSSTNPSSGDIIYRFMLGQDDHIDYDAIRNRHYKLTLCFNGNANDADWHIVYRKRPVEFPNPYMISYLYNHRMFCPVKINAGKSKPKLVRAEIVSNNWAPMNPGNFNYCVEADDPVKYPWNGFLSLRRTTATVLSKDAPWTISSNKDYYEKNDRGWYEFTDFSDGEHPDPKDPVQKYYVKHEVDKNGDNIYYLSIPMYTRAKQMIKETSFTGNNPYEAYRRLAEVKLSITLENDVELTPDENLKIIQGRRVVNPKGVYREWNSTRSFHAALKILSNEEASSFTPLTSEGGPWKAYVVRASGSGAQKITDKDGLEIGPSDPETTEDAHGMLTFSGGDHVYKSQNKLVSDTVYGLTGSPIDFYIDFNNSCKSADKSRHAVVRVEYNNNTCYHLIFVRQGNAPVRLLSGGTRWHCGNMISRSSEATTPIDEGSLFRYNGWNTPIESRSNTNGGGAYSKKGLGDLDIRKWVNWINIIPNSFTVNGGTNLYVHGKSGLCNWDDIEWTNNTNEGTAFEEPSLSDYPKARVAEWADFQALYKNDDIELGYGVMYGDDASETGTTLEESYGYYTGQPKTYGIRGVFVYNKTNGVSTFFPIGNSGYGHRKDNGENWSHVDQWPQVNGSPLRGLLRYACNARWGYFDATGEKYPEGVLGCPLFYDIFMRPGAVYWFGKTRHADAGSYPNDATTQDAILAGWDFNYFSFDFYPISNGNLSWGKDACFVRCVSD